MTQPEKNTNSKPAELLVISGKGGTGKTSICASLAQLSDNCVVVDCDVDAANMHLLLGPTETASEDFYSGFEARINTDSCIACGKCAKLCRFDAIKIVDGTAVIDPVRCEGCGVCQDVCPVDAARLVDRLCGELMVSDCGGKKLVHAELATGGENSGKLVSAARAKAREIAAANSSGRVVIDGPPGVGCAVIASAGGVDYAVIVTEPSVSGLHDLRRAADLMRHFSVPCGVLINKCDLDVEKAGQIKTFAENDGLEILGELPYEACFVQSHRAAKTVVEFAPDSAVALMLKKIHSRLDDIL